MTGTGTAILIHKPASMPACISADTVKLTRAGTAGGDCCKRVLLYVHALQHVVMALQAQAIVLKCHLMLITLDKDCHAAPMTLPQCSILNHCSGDATLHPQCFGAPAE